MIIDESTRLVVTLPVYRDAAFLWKTVEALEKATPPLTTNFTILIAEDGSDSSEVVSELKKHYPNIVHIQHNERLGRGRALREAWDNVEGDLFVYIDVDLAADLIQFDAYKSLIQNQEKFDLVTGSRYIEGSQTDRPLLRRLASLFYNGLVRLLFQTGVRDHQCGFKSFSKRLVQLLSHKANSDSWFWDTEVIVLTRKMGFNILEIPISWVERKGKKTPIMRLATSTTTISPSIRFSSRMDSITGISSDRFSRSL